MLPHPLSPLEAVLWDIHDRLSDAQLAGRGITAIDEEAKATISACLTSMDPGQVTALRRFMQRLDVEIYAIENERVRAVAAAEKAEADRRRFRAHVLNAMRAAGLERVHADGRLAFSVSTGRQSISVADPKKLPERFVQVIPERVVVRELKVRAALAAGEQLEGVLIVPGELTLVVR